MLRARRKWESDGAGRRARVRAVGRAVERHVHCPPRADTPYGPLRAFTPPSMPAGPSNALPLAAAASQVARGAAWHALWSHAPQRKRTRARTHARTHTCLRTYANARVHACGLRAHTRTRIAHLRGPPSLPHAGAAAEWPALDHTARRTRVVARRPHEPRERLGERELGSRPPMQRAVNRYAPLTNDAAAHLPRGAWARGGGRRSGRAESGVPMWRGREPSPSADVGSGDPSPGANVGGVGPSPRCRSGRGKPGPGADVAGYAQ
jgi:hypothetical protein